MTREGNSKVKEGIKRQNASLNYDIKKIHTSQLIKHEFVTFISAAATKGKSSSTDCHDLEEFPWARGSNMIIPSSTAKIEFCLRKSRLKMLVDCSDKTSKQRFHGIGLRAQL